MFYTVLKSYKQHQETKADDIEGTEFTQVGHEGKTRTALPGMGRTCYYTTKILQFEIVSGASNTRSSPQR